MATLSLRDYNQEIERLIDNKQLDEALAHCRHILKTFPKHIDTYRLFGRAYLEQQSFGNAADVFQRVLSSVPDDFISNIGMSIIREVEGNLDEAIWYMQLASETQPSNPAIMDELRRLVGLRDGVEPRKIRMTRSALARMYVKGELYQQAGVEVRAALDEYPERVDLKLLLAKISEKTGNKVEAIELAQSVVNKFPNSYDGNLILANLLASGSREQEAQAYRQVVNSLDPYSAYQPTGIQSLDQIPEKEVTLEWLEWSQESEAEGSILEFGTQEEDDSRSKEVILGIEPHDAAPLAGDSEADFEAIDESPEAITEGQDALEEEAMQEEAGADLVIEEELRAAIPGDLETPEGEALQAEASSLLEPESDLAGSIFEGLDAVEEEAMQEEAGADLVIEEGLRAAIPGDLETPEGEALQAEASALLEPESDLAGSIFEGLDAVEELALQDEASSLLEPDTEVTEAISEGLDALEEEGLEDEASTDLELEEEFPAEIHEGLDALDEQPTKFEEVLIEAETTLEEEIIPDLEAQDELYNAISKGFDSLEEDTRPVRASVDTDFETELHEAIPEGLDEIVEQTTRFEETFLDDEVLFEEQAFPEIQAQDELSKAISEGLDALAEDSPFEEYEAGITTSDDQDEFQAGILSTIDDEADIIEELPPGSEAESVLGVDIPDWLFSAEEENQEFEKIAAEAEASHLLEIPDKLPIPGESGDVLASETDIETGNIPGTEIPGWLDQIEEPELAVEDTRPSKTTLASLGETGLPAAISQNETIPPEGTPGEEITELESVSAEEEMLAEETRDDFDWMVDLEPGEKLAAEAFLFSGTEQAEVTPDWVLEDSETDLNGELTQAGFELEDANPEAEEEPEAYPAELTQEPVQEEELLQEDEINTPDSSEWVNLESEPEASSFDAGYDQPVRLQEVSSLETIAETIEAETGPGDAEVQAESGSLQEGEETIQADAIGELTVLEKARQALSGNDYLAGIQAYSEEIKAERALPEIITDLEKAVEEKPDSFELWQLLGDAYLHADQLRSALDAYHKAEDLLG